MFVLPIHSKIALICSSVNFIFFIPLSFDTLSIAEKGLFVKPYMQFLLAVSQIPARPAIYTDLIARLADFKRLLLGLHPLGLVNIIDAVGEPYTAVSAEILNGVDSFAGGLTLNAVSSNLPTGLVIDFLAIFKGQAVIFSEFENRTNVNHVVIPFRFGRFSFPYCDYSIAPFQDSVY